MGEFEKEIVNVILRHLEAKEYAIRNTVHLLEKDNTIPFIARYRKEQTNNMDVDTIRRVKSLLDELKAVKARVASVKTAIEKLGKMTSQLKSALNTAENLHEVEHLYAPFKSGSKRTLAERARELGLESVALELLERSSPDVLRRAVKPEVEGRATEAEVQTGVQHIIADIVAKDKETLDLIRDFCRTSYITLESSKSRAAVKKAKEAETDKKPASAARGGKDSAEKFELYFNFSTNIKYIRSHQVLAINRGESLKVLTVKVNIPDRVKQNFMQFATRKWIRPQANGFIRKLITDSFEDAYKRLLEPLMVRNFRSEITKNAEKASVDVFMSNLRRLLLTPPVRGKVVFGLDPGFRNGCKFAVTSSTGKVLETGVVYLHEHHKNQHKEMERLKEVIQRHSCEAIALGNGVACRETEVILSKMIQRRAFSPIEVAYCIVSESGASIYSASDVAQKEFPDLDVSLRGGISIARRLQDPMAELVKIEPKHIGVGMYQHDISESQLKTGLDGVVEECVSFVGVDVNSCSEMLLRRVAGLNSARAKKILEHRDKNGPFVNRQQVRDIKGIGPKSFEQCAGFIRLLPETRGGGKRATNSVDSDGDSDDDYEPAASTSGRKRKGATKKSSSKKAKLDAMKADNLDMTCIHPESYHVANRFLKLLGISKDGIGQASLIAEVKQYMSSHSVSDVASELGVGEPTMQLIIDGLRQPIGHDIREEFEKPLFKKGVSSLRDLKPGTILTGRVTNATHFGAFIDVGVGRDGLVHSSKMNPSLLKGKRALELGDKIEVRVLNVDVERNKLSLELTQLLS